MEKRYFFNSRTKFENRKKVLKTLLRYCKQQSEGQSDFYEEMGKTSPAYNSPQGSFGSEGNLRPPIGTSLLPTTPQNEEAPPLYYPFDPFSSSSNPFIPLVDYSPSSINPEAEKSELMKRMEEEKMEAEKQKIAEELPSLEGPLVAQKPFLTQSELLKTIKKGMKKEGIDLAMDGLKDNCTIRIAQIKDNAPLSHDHFSRKAVDLQHRKCQQGDSAFYEVNPLIAFQEVCGGG